MISLGTGSLNVGIVGMQFPVNPVCAYWFLDGTYGVQLIRVSHAWRSCKSVRPAEILSYLSSWEVNCLCPPTVGSPDLEGNTSLPAYKF